MREWILRHEFARANICNIFESAEWFVRRMKCVRVGLYNDFVRALLNRYNNARMPFLNGSAFVRMSNYARE